MVYLLQQLDRGLRSFSLLGLDFEIDSQVPGSGFALVSVSVDRIARDVLFQALSDQIETVSSFGARLLPYQRKKMAPMLLKSDVRSQNEKSSWKRWRKVEEVERGGGIPHR